MNSKIKVKKIINLHQSDTNKKNKINVVCLCACVYIRIKKLKRKQTRKKKNFLKTCEIFIPIQKKLKYIIQIIKQKKKLSIFDEVGKRERKQSE